MAIPAKLALPFPSFIGPSQPAVERAIGGKTTLFSAPAGYLFTSYLASLLSQKKLPVIWLRATTEDHDPAALLHSLSTGAEKVFPGVSARTANLARSQPGSLHGWQTLFEILARDIGDAARQARSERAVYSLAVVIEHIDVLQKPPARLSILLEHFFNGLPDDAIRIATSHTRLPRASIPGAIHKVNTYDLRLDENNVAALVSNSPAAGLSRQRLEKIITLMDGQGVALDGLFSACQALGIERFQRAIDAASHPAELMRRVAQAYLRESAPGVQAQACLAAYFDYLRPANGAEPRLPDKWTQILTDDWTRLQCVWRDTLRSITQADPIDHQDLLKRAALALAEEGDEERAIPLLLDLPAAPEAAEALARIVDRLADRGQWETMSGWLGRLPPAVRDAWPDLIYAEGELAMVRGRTGKARQKLARATRLYTEHGNFGGACKCMLVESSLSAWQGQPTQARRLAETAHAIAASTGLTWHQSWASWQLGSLATRANQIEEALNQFTLAEQAAVLLPEQHMANMTRQASQLALAQLLLQRETEDHLRAIQAANQTASEQARQLKLLVEQPVGQIDELPRPFGWWQSPNFARAPRPGQPFNSLRALIDRLLHPARPAEFSPGAQQPASLAPMLALAAEVEAAMLPGSPAQPNPANEPPTGPEPRPGLPSIAAYLLGSFHLAINSQPITTWPSGRARSVFTYILTQPDRLTPRDVIMETFWPEHSPESARNSLNVAVHSLRQALRQAVEEPVILFQNNAYQINPDLALWLDYRSFERHAEAGQAAEQAARIKDAVRQYELAISLYQGDFLSENLYEDWPVVERERLRVIYMDTLDRLSLIHLEMGEYAACASLCQRMLNHDRCREDAHCRLMRCYSRQGQNHLALRQFQACLTALREELDVDPSPAAIQLHEQIRRQEAV